MLIVSQTKVNLMVWLHGNNDDDNDYDDDDDDDDERLLAWRRCVDLACFVSSVEWNVSQ